MRQPTLIGFGDNLLFFCYCELYCIPLLPFYCSSLVWGILEECLYHIPRPSRSYFRAVRGHVDVGSKLNHSIMRYIHTYDHEHKARGGRTRRT